jgi:hypothetical protein
MVGGRGNSLDRNYNYSTEKDINTNVGFVKLFQRHDRPWMNKRVGSMNLRLDQALMSSDMSHINVTDASSFMRENLMRYGLHLNSRGKKRLMQLVAERVVDDQVSSTSSIPLITCATASPFLA